MVFILSKGRISFKPIDISVLHKVYHAFYKPLEYTIAEKDANQCYIKVVGNMIASFYASSHKAFTRSNDQISAEVFWHRNKKCATSTK